MRYFNIIIYLLLFTISKSQNLINNPSFELLSSCPIVGGNHSATLCVNWVNPTQAGTPDVFNACCSSTTIPCVPYTYKQLPKTGNTFTGIWCLDNSFTNLREYLHTQISNQLVSGNYYFIRFYTVLGNFFKYASNNLGMYLSSNTIYQSGVNNFLLNYTPQIKKFNNPVIADTLNWVEISGVYQANGTENYITIGNFDNDITTDTLAVNINNYAGSYYLIEDVSVENITTPQWQYLDTTIYLGDSVLIGPAITGLNVDWFDMSSTFIKNAPGIYVKPTVTTPYKATETFNSVVYNHTVTVTVLMPVQVNEYELLQNSVTIYPNPTTNNFTISYLTESSKLKVDITDTQGKLYSTEIVTITNNKTIIKTNLTNGVYFVSITDTVSGLKTIKKLIVQK
jgi:hypothetical protein